MTSAKHHDKMVYTSTAIQNFLWMLIRLPPFKSIRLPIVELIKTNVLKSLIGNIILFEIISPPIGQEFD